MAKEVKRVEVVEDAPVDALVPVNGEFPTMVRELNDALVNLSVDFERARDALVETVKGTVDDIKDRTRRVQEFRAALQADMDKNFAAISGR